MATNFLTDIGLPALAGLGLALNQIRQRNQQEALAAAKLMEGSGQFVPMPAGQAPATSFLTNLFGSSDPNQLRLGNQALQFQPYQQIDLPGLGRMPVTPQNAAAISEVLNKIQQQTAYNAALGESSAAAPLPTMTQAPARDAIVEEPLEPPARMRLSAARVPPRLQPYIPLAQEFGQKYGLDPELILGLIAQESNGDARAIGPGTRYGWQAKGLMQLSPGVERDYGVKDVFNPRQNVEAGTAYLADLTQQFKDLPTALVAYNWGPGNVRTAGGKLLPSSRAFAERVDRSARSFVEPASAQAADLRSVGLRELAGGPTRQAAAPVGNPRLDQLNQEIAAVEARLERHQRASEAAPGYTGGNQTVDNLRQLWSRKVAQRDFLLKQEETRQGRYEREAERTRAREERREEWDPTSQVYQGKLRLSREQGAGAADIALEKQQDTPIPVREISRVYDPNTLNPVEFGTTFKEAKARGARALDEVNARRLGEMESAAAFLDQMEEKIQQVYGPGGPLAEVTNANLQTRLKGAARLAYERITQEDPNVRDLKGLFGLYQTQVARVLAGERGATTEGDIGRALKSVPNLEGFPDTKEQVASLMKTSRELIDRTRRRVILGRAGAPRAEAPTAPGIPRDPILDKFLREQSGTR